MRTQQFGHLSYFKIGGLNTSVRMNKPKVLRIINRFNLGGPTYNVGYLSKYMEDEFETLLVGGMKDESEDSSEFIVEKLGLSPIIIPEMKREISPKMDRIAYQKIKKIIDDFQPDIVHTHASKSGAIGRLAAAKMRVLLSYIPFMVMFSIPILEKRKQPFTSKSSDILHVNPLSSSQLVKSKNKKFHKYIILLPLKNLK